MSARPKLAAIVLAAGRSTRMGSNKLLAEYGGKPLVRHVVETAIACGAEPVLVVVGHEADAVAIALGGLDITLVRNPDYADGLSTSLRAGIAAMPQGHDGAVVLLGDMPKVSSTLVRRLIAAFEGQPGGIAAVPVHDGEWGNPVVLAAALFADVADLEGDAGARKLLRGRADDVIEVPVSDPAVIVDVDTPEALARLRRER